MPTRRTVVALGAGAFLLGQRPGRASPDVWAGLDEKFTALELSSGGRLGVAVWDGASDRRAGHRADERFPMCSTFKILAAGAILARVDAGREQLERRIRFETADVVTYSPATQHRTGGDGMTLAELCEAALTLSDNTAANLLLAALGGPAGLTAFARDIGDTVTRLDRIETALNEATPGDPRDTTTPSAMLGGLHTLLLGAALSASSKQRLETWLLNCKTGDKRLRAGLPESWRIGDKTGSGDHGTTNDVAAIWPPGRPPLLVAVYLTQTAAGMDDRNAVIAAVGRAIAAAV